MNNINIDKIKIEKLIKKYPYCKDFFEQNNIDISDLKQKNIDQAINIAQKNNPDLTNLNELKENLLEFILLMEDILNKKEKKHYEITIKPGTDKTGKKENFSQLEFKRGEIIAIVGPTGSGKSRLLADIEWAANKDTPTNRQILINKNTLNIEQRFSTSNKLVAQLSQNMNFVMDLTVEEFLTLHATSRLISNKEKIISSIFEKANNLAGEKFNLTTPITNLSGGQSRALMIADTAILSKSPIVLIDEIENAGIDRKKALEVLINEEKIVLISTHDPILALMADKRIVIKNGGINKVIETTKEEKESLYELEKIDKKILNMRIKLRSGKKIIMEE